MAKKQEQENTADMLRQFDTLKQKHPDAMLLFRKGDFYEMYREDAVKAAAILAITLTSRAFPGEKEPVKYTCRKDGDNSSKGLLIPNVVEFPHGNPTKGGLYL